MRSSSQNIRISAWGGFEVNLWEIRADPQQSHHLLLTTPNCLAWISGCSCWDFWLLLLGNGFLVPCRNSEMPQAQIPAPTDGSASGNHHLPLHTSNIHIFPEPSTGNFVLTKLQTGRFQANKRCHLCTHSLFLSLLNWSQEIGVKQW